MRLVQPLLMLSVIVSLSPPAALAAPQQDPGALFAAIESPSVNGEIDPPASIVVGHAQIRPGTGARVFVLSASGRRCGLLIDGAATATYSVDEPFSVPLARRNASRAHGLTLRESGNQATLSATLTGAAIWGWDLDVGSSQPRPADRPLPQWVQDILEKQFGSNPGRDMLVSASNGEPGYRWAVLHTQDDDLELDVDPRAAVRAEALGRLWKLPGGGPYSGQLVVEPLVDQPIGRRWWDSLSPDFASTETDITLKNDSGPHATITTRTRLQALHDHMAMLQVALLQEWVTERDDRRPMKLTRLALDGVQVSSVQAADDLLVALPRPINKGESVLLETVTEGPILEFPAGDNYWALRTTPWYPMPYAQGIQWSSYHLSISVPPPLVPFAAGEIVQAPTAANGNTVTTDLKGPMQWATAIAGKYSTVTDERDGIRVHVSTYAEARPGEAHRLAGVVHAVRGCMEQMLGVTYPFPDLQVMEVNEWGWGQAPPGMIFITKEALLSHASSAMLNEDDRPIAELVSRGINERIAHEVAHAWFPHVAKNYAGEDNWLSESFAEYTSAVCVERASADKGRGKYLFNRSLSQWKTMTGQTTDLDSIYLAAHLGGREADRREYRSLLYGKGPLVLHALRQELARVSGNEQEGDRLFFTWLRSYIKNFTYKLAGTRHLVAILNQMTGKDWQPWFERYVYGTETPKLN